MAPEIARLFLSSNVMHCIFIDADELDHFLVQQDALLHRNCPRLVIRFWIVDCDFDFEVPEVWQRIEFHWEVFNVLNTPHFDIPGRIAFSPNFGRIFNRRIDQGIQLGVWDPSGQETSRR
jgi:hypothetical protein